MTIRPDVSGRPVQSLRPPRRRRAFTLIELLVVITILGILGAMIVPQFAAGHQDALLRAAGREIVSAMGLAYSQAVSQGRPCRLCIDPLKNLYRLESRRERNFQEEAYELLRDVPGASGVIDRRIRILVKDSYDQEDLKAPRGPWGGEEPRSAEETITFQSDGTAEARDVVFQDAEGFVIRLRVSPITARVEIEGPEREAAR